jgi:Fe-S oxidoreductase
VQVKKGDALSTLEIIIFTLLFIAAILFFLKNIFRLLATISLGRWENRFDRLWSRLKNLVVYGFGQRSVVRARFGINHFFLFWGFLVLILINFEFLVSGVFPQFSFVFLGETLYGILLFLADIMSVVVLAAVFLALLRRTFFRPEHIEPTREAYFILTLVGSLMIAYFGLHASEAYTGHLEMAAWMPVSTALAPLFSGMSEGSAFIWGRIFWWIHALVLLFFLNYLPYSKHLHILTALLNTFFMSESLVTTVPRLKFEKGEDFGVSKVVQFTWKDILDFMSCTECGRCQEACPAYQTGKPLNPRLVIHQGKLNAFANGDAVRADRPADMLASAPKDASMVVPLIAEGEASISEEALWSCTTCGACMEVCPVFIEHVPKIIEMRQHLVMEQSKFPAELTALFEDSEQRCNPWGIAPSDRVNWARDLEVPIIKEPGEKEYLLYVGCAGAYDARARNISIAMTNILNAAGLSWGILGNEEKCCGDSMRRLGNEFVFEKMAKENIEIFKKYDVKKIITFCPHGYSTLKHDYAQFGADFEVIHHTELIKQLIDSGKIKLKSKSNGKVVIHDSCYLGRYNGIYEQPREIIAACSGGVKPTEMERHGDKSFCCGAGGGRMWMEELTGKRIYLERTQEALKQDPSTIAVACPYCMTMFEDGIKDEKAYDRVLVKDIAEMVCENLA